MQTARQLLFVGRMSAGSTMLRDDSGAVILAGMKGLATCRACVLVPKHCLTCHLVEEWQVDWREGRDHVLLTVRLPDELVVSLR